MDNRLRYSRFLAQVFTVVLSGACLVAIVVLVVDPYRLYQIVDAAGFNYIKPPPERYREEIKLSRALAVNANAYIAGNSRAEIGFNPEVAAQLLPGRTFYNIALAGTDIATTRSELRFLSAHRQPPSVMVLGVEFLDFLSRKERTNETDVAGTPHPAEEWKWKVDALFSLASLTDAARTLRIQRMKDPESISAYGHNPLLEYRRFAREQGYYMLFQQRAVENAGAYLDKPGFLRVEGQINDLRAILDTILRTQGELHLVIYPYHAQILAMFEQTGLWPLFDEWKRLLVDEIDRANNLHPEARLTLWDFSGYAQYHCERIPGKNEKTETRWYWEAGHFKQQLGDKVLEKIFSGDAKPGIENQFGFALTSTNFEDNRARIMRERQECRQAYPELFVQAGDLINAAATARSVARNEAKPAGGALLAGAARHPR